MKFIVYLSLIALLLTPTFQQIVPDANLDQFLSAYVGAWLSANLGTYLNSALAPLLNKLASLESLATATPATTTATTNGFNVLPTSAPSGGSILCYVCNESWAACRSPIDVARLEGNLVRCNGQCVKYQNPNDGMSINYLHLDHFFLFKS